MLFGLNATDVITCVAVMFAVTPIVMLAVAIPAWHAACAEPLLRCDISGSYRATRSQRADSPGRCQVEPLMATPRRYQRTRWPWAANVGHGQRDGGVEANQPGLEGQPEALWRKMPIRY